MPAPLHRVVRLLRLALVCLALVWSSAPAATAPITDTIVLVAVTRDPPAQRAPPADRVAPTPEEPAAQAADDAPAAGPITGARPPSRPRRLYLEQRALLC